jgi:hypothetical protein
MADPSLFVDTNSGTGIYGPCLKGVEVHMSVAPGNQYQGTAFRVTAAGDAPDRVAVYAGGAPVGYTLFKNSHDDPPPTNYSSRLRINIPFPPGGQPAAVLISCSNNGGVSQITINPDAPPANNA